MTDIIRPRMPDAFPMLAIPRDDERYPDLLRRIADPPDVLYCRGNIALLHSFCVAIVGTRRMSDYGEKAALDLAGNLASSGMTIVSGLALGIDAVAHRAALDAAGSTIAVLGSGVDDPNIGPPSNRLLARRILEHGGCIVSEYPAGTSAHPGTFPRRNRIISGLSHGVLVVEAARQSGSLITARCALEQDRDVFAIPGSIYWPASAGTNWLIAQGARPVTSAIDIRDHYQLRQESLPSIAVSTDDSLQAGILALVRTEGPMHIDAIVAAAQADPARVMTAVAFLVLHGSLRQENDTYSIYS